MKQLTRRRGEKINRSTTGSNFGYAGPMTVTINMGVVGMYYPGEKLEWDGDKLEFKKSEANQYLHREYREEYRLPLRG